MEPPPSLPSASAAMPVHTAAAEPPDDPPGVRSRFHGLRVTPHASDAVHGQSVSSGTLVLPTISAPAFRNLVTTSASSALTPRSAREPHAVDWPATSVSSLIATGTPASG